MTSDDVLVPGRPATRAAAAATTAATSAAVGTTATRTTPAEVDAMDRALTLAARGPVHGPNPRVGCVLLAPAAATDSHPTRGGRTEPDVVHRDAVQPDAVVCASARAAVLAEGWHAGVGTPHAEVAALLAARDAGVDVRGCTAVVTLEPCNHTGRTGPCAQALLDAGVARVVIAVADSNPVAAGGADHLRAAGVDVVTGVREAEGRQLLRTWLPAVERSRPFVTLKIATTLDGRVAAADGSSRWITSEVARQHAHSLRADCDAVVVGTGTVATDDPSLTARTADGELAAHQPLRVVVGHRPVPDGARLRGPGGDLLHLATHDPAEVLADLHGREVRHVLVEGGPTLAAAFLRAGLVDEVYAYIAPVLLGSGPSAVGDLGLASITDALRLVPREPVPLGPDVLVVAAAPPRPEAPAVGAAPAAPSAPPTAPQEEH
ncbi:bifunctional diaminohydroxyphosphoribosylaminopyrimidine deaminase/5-amino-6-(5-phosphoribosylamino)uracil reductase RibD [uncultured Cellulomonas sp.]|uniref:bifunctional diaminohydroxyphosphoribosylaminopyrimidine deaminase/5-amino-6-(5-phosphoribosylamino)uracil reductase RibD n=1 Tax=uncultured Cellulomonas sp. TaxID=189682 RepID=UPI0026085068|nr:bifunctional diaminohydroxyphosphoribosylaminopyrimidine deaminase/5-amino-6-(5-phosphoribosylamino)uracil reductase RibD [uncultured Cellulomonas sp.]